MCPAEPKPGVHENLHENLLVHWNGTRGTVIFVALISSPLGWELAQPRTYTRCSDLANDDLVRAAGAGVLVEENVKDCCIR